MGKIMPVLTNKEFAKYRAQALAIQEEIEALEKKKNMLLQGLQHSCMHAFVAEINNFGVPPHKRGYMRWCLICGFCSFADSNSEFGALENSQVVRREWKSPSESFPLKLPSSTDIVGLQQCVQLAGLSEAETVEMYTKGQ